jgi:alpha/beta hydrolase family protein
VRNFKWKRILLIVLILLALAVGGFVVWADTPLTPMPEALAALQSDAQAQVASEHGWTVFRPADQMLTTGFIFYPGGRVDARAYAPQLHAIAAEGYLVVLTPMPLNLAIFGVNDASAVIAAYPDIKHWEIGGHSLGGSMAARFVQSNPSAVQGLVFWASYPDINLSDSNLVVTSVYGTRDGLATPDNIAASHPLLPADTAFVAIEGGDHGQFGWYGDQPGDNPATISREEQQAQTVQATVDVLGKIGQ